MTASSSKKKFDTASAVVVRISPEDWKRIGRLTERIGQTGANLGLGTPSKNAVMRAALDRGIHALGREVSLDERRSKTKAKQNGKASSK